MQKKQPAGCFFVACNLSRDTRPGYALREQARSHTSSLASRKSVVKGDFLWERACSRWDLAGGNSLRLNQRQQHPPRRGLDRAFRRHYMHPTTGVAHEQQGRTLAMQRTVVVPAETIRQRCAVQLGALAQLTGELGVGQRFAAQLIAAMFQAGAVLVLSLIHI